MKIVVWICWRHVLNNCPNILRFLLRFRFFSRFYRKSYREMCDVVLVWTGSTKIKPWMELFFSTSDFQPVSLPFQWRFCTHQSRQLYIYNYICIYIHSMVGNVGELWTYTVGGFSPLQPKGYVCIIDPSRRRYEFCSSETFHTATDQEPNHGRSSAFEAALCERFLPFSLMGIWCG